MAIIYIRVERPETDQDAALEATKTLAAQIGGEAMTPIHVHSLVMGDMPFGDRVEFWGDDR